MTPTTRTLEFIAGFEGFRAISYLDPVGVWTIGYGTTRICGQKVTQGMQINEPVGRALLYGDALEAMQAVEQLVTVPLNPDQLDALTSLTYNIGEDHFRGSTLLRELNAGRVIERDYFMRWNKGRVSGVLTALPGLTIRRRVEYERFTRGTVRA